MEASCEVQPLYRTLPSSLRDGGLEPGVPLCRLTGGDQMELAALALMPLAVMIGSQCPAVMPHEAAFGVW